LLFERLTVGRLDEAGRERFHREQMAAAELVGLERSRIPPTTGALGAYLDEVIASGIMCVGGDTLKVANLIRHPPAGVPWRPVLRRVSRWAFGTLPEQLRRLYGIRWNALKELELRGSLASLKLLRPALPSGVRQIVPARQAAHRVASAPSG